MLFTYFLTALLAQSVATSPAPIAAAIPNEIEERTVNGHCSGTATGQFLSKGICISTSTCSSYSGVTINGGCPSDGNNIKCCLIGLGGSVSVNPCGGSSYCQWAADSCPGTFRSGYCPGLSNYRCCLL